MPCLCSGLGINIMSRHAARHLRARVRVYYPYPVPIQGAFPSTASRSKKKHTMVLHLESCYMSSATPRHATPAFANCEPGGLMPLHGPVAWSPRTNVRHGSHACLDCFVVWPPAHPIILSSILAYRVKTDVRISVVG